MNNKMLLGVAALAASASLIAPTVVGADNLRLAGAQVKSHFADSARDAAPVRTLRG